MKILKTGKQKRSLLIILAVIVLYAGAYLFGRYVVNPQETPPAAAVQADQITEEQIAALENQALTESRYHQNLAEGAALSGESCPVSFFLTDLQNLVPEETIPLMKSCNVSFLTIPLVWSNLEKTEGVFDPSEYDTLLSPYVDAGFQFIFLLDGAGRHTTSLDLQTVVNSIPEWVLQKRGTTLQCDFLGRSEAGYGLSYNSPENQDLYLHFCRQAIDYFGKNYKENLVGFAPCITNEFEIKYPQIGYAWNDYGVYALGGFRSWLKNTYGTINDMNTALGTSYIGFPVVPFPIITYNNTISSGALPDDPLFVDFQRFREQSIVNFVTPVFELIRCSGYTSLAYFGQTLAGQDAIYASGIATKLASLADIAVIDFNFYDGYNIVYDSIIPATLVNYVRNAGYSQVWAGVYFERIPYLDHQEMLQETIDYVAADGLACGFEIRGIQENIAEKGDAGKPDLVYGIKPRSETARIAILAGEWNFYKSHGEKVRYYNFFSDALTQMYKILRFELQEPVDILCDDAILRGDIEKYDLLVLPGQFYVDPQVREKIENYLSGGGKALMDFRFGEWDINGRNTGSWSDSFFGIVGRESRNVASLTLQPQDSCPISDLAEYTVRSLYPRVPNLYATVPKNGAHALFKDESGHLYGICTDQTVILGFQPQLQYKYAESEEERDAAVHLIRTVVSWLMDQ